MGDWVLEDTLLFIQKVGAVSKVDLNVELLNYLNVYKKYLPEYQIFVKDQKSAICI
jgi:hypothetical protein